jgi:hypothetical protein
MESINVVVDDVVKEPMLEVVPSVEAILKHLLKRK